ncbi:phytoene desaturase [Rhodococcus triatomae]|uniref:Phytoene desaturase n=1 Tax=Rhodococcus triatomae TaxID=300028 RepID=A0A1G8D3F5_9NOCA|nr:phytoene desaturase family protein [Rhodococcus triatomae]QNG18518.1 phytoene desaturase [Rhodococcus triatomae]QNG21813.1 phytoene desaturase [Rhodococcus triatomae]SDH52308.1 phytoene desaturase [Rhodococcus triatomae]
MSPLRRVSGPTDHVVIVGAGLAGLSAALHLLGSGRKVTVVEAESAPGGRVGTYRGPGYEIDNGATVLTMPELVGDALAAVGASAVGTVPALEIQRLSPAYHARFADGTSLDVHSDADRMVAEVTRLCGPAEAERYLRLRRWLGEIFDAEFDRFMASDFDSPLDLVSSAAARRDLATLVRLGGFGRLGRRVDATLEDPRLRRIFTFQALYAGVPPRSALGVYGAIAHMDTTLGVYFPRGGMRTVALAMADAFTRAGGTMRLGHRVSSVTRSGPRASAVVLDDGSELDCDALVLTPDAAVVEHLLPEARRRVRPRRSPSAVVLHGTVPSSVAARWPARRHHTIDFGAAWEQTFAEITARRGQGALMSDPSLLITRPSVTDPALAVRRDDDPDTPAEPLSVLAPCPNLDSAPLDWPTLGGPYASEILATLEGRGYTGIADAFRIDRMDTPHTWQEQGMAAGSPFADAHIFRQTGPFRRSNLVRAFDNVVLAGSSTVPGVGVPSVLLSGRLAAERIAGTRQSSG